MAFKFISFFALVAAANAGLIPAAPVAYHAAPLAYAAPVAKAVVTKTFDADYDAHPQYNYGYDVQDSLTGDFKSQHESRDGDVVQGSYSLIEADGSRRTVDYTADSVNGFNAVVHKEPAQVAVKAVHAAPLAVKAVHAAPLAVKAVHAAPLAVKAVHAAPLAYAAAPIAYAAAPTYTHHAAPLAYAAAPTYTHAAAPLAYAAPTYAHAAPVAYAAPTVYHH